MNKVTVDDAIYMIRNYMAGTDENTRISDDDGSTYYLDTLPDDLKLAAQTILKDEHGYDCDGAIRIFCRYHLKGITWAELEPMVVEWVNDFIDDETQKEDFEDDGTDSRKDQIAEIKAGYHQLRY